MATGVHYSSLMERRLRIPRGIFTLEKFRRWAASKCFPEHGRTCYLAGDVFVDMSPEEIESHSKVKRDLAFDLQLHLRQTDLGEVLPDGVLVVNKAADLAAEPDLILCTWDSIRSSRVQYREVTKGSLQYNEVVGTPDLVVEVVSRSSVGKDRKRLPKLYYAAGIPEYWLIDARRDEIDFQLHLRGESEYTPSEPDAEGYRFSPLLQKRVLLTRDRNPVGGWRYELRLR